MKKLIAFFLPEIIKSYIRIIKNKINLSKCSKNICNTEKLREVDNNFCEEICQKISVSM